MNDKETKKCQSKQQQQNKQKQTNKEESKQLSLFLSLSHLFKTDVAHSAATGCNVHHRSRSRTCT